MSILMLGLLAVVAAAFGVSMRTTVSRTIRRAAVVAILACALFGSSGIFLSHRLGWESFDPSHYAGQSDVARSAFYAGAVSAGDAGRHFLPLVIVSLIALFGIAFSRE